MCWAAFHSSRSFLKQKERNGGGVDRDKKITNLNVRTCTM